MSIQQYRSNGIASATQPFIEINGLRKKFNTPAGEFEILKGINIEFEVGEFVAVIGKSGSGKSTFINMLSGIDTPTGGTVRIGENEIHNLNETQMAQWRGKNLGIVFQFFQLLPTLTVIENVMLPMQINKIGTPQSQKERALELLTQMGVAQHADKLPATLSGGQQQRVAIARSLVNDPELIIADEPTGNLDTKTAEEIFQLFKQLVADGKTILMVTHDDDFARRVDRTVIVSDGKVVNEFLVKALRQLSKDLILDVAQKIEPVVYNKGEVVVRQHEEGDLFYIVTEGALDVAIEKPNGASLVVDHREPGEYFGEMAIVGETTRSATVIAATDTVELLEIDRPLFEQLLEDSNAFRSELEAIIKLRTETVANVTPVANGRSK